MKPRPWQETHGGALPLLLRDGPAANAQCELLRTLAFGERHNPHNNRPARRTLAALNLARRLNLRPDKIPEFLQWTRRAERAARRLNKLYAIACNEDMPEAQLEKAEKTLPPKPPAGFFWYFQRDPRGLPLYLLPDSIDRKKARYCYHEETVYFPEVF